MINELKDKFKDFKPSINGSQNMQKASVTIPIVKIEDTYNILFEVRSKNLRTQPSEISFPGGKHNFNEDPLSAAIRETCEELGTNASNIELITELDLYVNYSQLMIHPYLIYIKDLSKLDINKDEVDHIFYVPISTLLRENPISYHNEVHIIPNKNFPYDIIPNKENYEFKIGSYKTLFYKYNNYIIWGITANILENFLDIIRN